MKHRASIATVFLLAGAATALGQSEAPRTLGRTIDTVVIPGSRLGPELQGVPKGRVRVYACRGGFMVPIVYQIDERTPDGGWCYDQGPSEHHVEDEDGGKIDGNDELVVRAQDAGDRARERQLRGVPGYDAVAELELTDPLDDGRAWVYVFRFDGPVVPGRLTKDVVDLSIRRTSEEEGRYRWEGESFTFNNNRAPLNAVRATYGAFERPEGGRGHDMLDCTWVKAVVTFMWVEVVRKSGDVKVRVGGYIDGPLRVIAQNQLQIYLALGFWVEAPDSYIVLWPNRVSMPTNATCPVDLDESGESSYTLVYDLNRGAKGWKFYNSHNPDPVTIDGRTSRAERNLDMSWPDWNCAYGPQGAIITKFVVPPELRRPTNRLHYRDDEHHRREGDEEGIEFEKGCFGTNGYYLDMSGLDEGVYSGDYVVWYCPPPFEKGDHVPYLNEYEHPLEVRRTEVD